MNSAQAVRSGASEASAMLVAALGMMIAELRMEPLDWSATLYSTRVAIRIVERLTADGAAFDADTGLRVELAALRTIALQTELGNPASLEGEAVAELTGAVRELIDGLLETGPDMTLCLVSLHEIGYVAAAGGQ